MTNVIIGMRKDLSKSVIELLDKCFDKVKLKSFEDEKLYATFITYRNRWKKDKLGEKQIKKVLNHFGYDVSVKKTYIVNKRKED